MKTILEKIWRTLKPFQPPMPESSYVVRGRTTEEIMIAGGFHEAGHVVAACLLGLNVHYAILERRSSASEVLHHGYTELTYGRVDDYGSMEQAMAALNAPDMLRKRTIQVLAGQIAESMVSDHEADIRSGAAEDDRSAYGYAALATGLTEPADDRAIQALTEYLNTAWRDAAALLADAAPALHAVGRYLIEHVNERIDGATLHRIVASHRPAGAATE